MKPYQHFSPFVYLIDGLESIESQENVDKGNKKRRQQGSTDQPKEKAKTMIKNAEKDVVKLSDKREKGNIKKLSDRNFTTEVLESTKPVMVVFDTSGDNSIVSELQKEYRATIDFGSYDMSENNKVASELKIRGYPTFVIFVRGKIVSITVGPQGKKLKKILDSL